MYNISTVLYVLHLYLLSPGTWQVYFCIISHVPHFIIYVPHFISYLIFWSPLFLICLIYQSTPNSFSISSTLLSHLHQNPRPDYSSRLCSLGGHIHLFVYWSCWQSHFPPCGRLVFTQSFFTHVVIFSFSAAVSDCMCTLLTTPSRLILLVNS